MNRIYLLFMLFFLLYGENNITSPKTISVYPFEQQLRKIDFYIKYKQYQSLLKIKQKLEQIKKEIKKLKESKNADNKKLEKLILEKIAYQKQLEIMSGGKDNLFDSIISMEPLPKPFHIKNPFSLISAINYNKKINSLIKKYEKKYSELDTIINILEKRKKV